ncbi:MULTISPECIES: hypothetical protein [Acetobacter]|jgi:starvation-inducible outer membrane lipoprotein|nr:hypothetical protein [Acetobacter peroxydans]
MKRAVLLLACALGLSACGSTPRHITSPAQWQKLGFHDHIQSSGS